MLKKKLFLFANVNMISLMLMFLNSIMAVRLIGGNIYGMYQYIFALAAVIPTTYSFADNTIIRFLGAADIQHQKAIIKFVAMIKTIIGVVAFSIFILWCIFFMDGKTESVIKTHSVFLYVLVLEMFILPVNMVSNSLNTVINALEKYRYTAIVSTTQPFVYAGLLILLTLIEAKKEHALYVIISFSLLSAISACSASIIFLQKSGWFKEIYHAANIPKTYSFVYNNYFKSYTMPLSMGVFFQYIKTQLPTVILGHVTTFNDVAYYKVFRTLFDVLNRFFPKITDIFLPSIVKQKKVEPGVFNDKFVDYSIKYLIGIGIVSSSILLCYPILLKIIRIETDAQASFVVMLFGVSTVLGSMNFIMNYAFKLESDVTHFFVLSILSNVSQMLFLGLLSRFGVVGVVFAEIARQLVWLSLSGIVSWKRKIMNIREYLKMSAATFASMALLIILYFMRSYFKWLTI
jgi:O-antigen/teichoic acid export membrane protein